jgi:formylglycine-generating enzyme required for sulfatase activity
LLSQLSLDRAVLPSFQAAILLLSMALLLKGVSALCRRVNNGRRFPCYSLRQPPAQLGPTNISERSNTNTQQSSDPERPKSLHGVWVELPDGSITLGTLPSDDHSRSSYDDSHHSPFHTNSLDNV